MGAGGPYPGGRISPPTFDYFRPLEPKRKRKQIAKVPNYRKETKQFQSLGFLGNHVVSELLKAKNLNNFGFFGDFWLFLGGFWPVAALKPLGCKRNLEILIVWFLTAILVPLLSKAYCPGVFVNSGNIDFEIKIELHLPLCIERIHFSNI